MNITSAKLSLVLTASWQKFSLAALFLSFTSWQYFGPLLIQPSFLLALLTVASDTLSPNSLCNFLQISKIVIEIVIGQQEATWFRILLHYTNQSRKKVKSPKLFSKPAMHRKNTVTTKSFTERIVENDIELILCNQPLVSLNNVYFFICICTIQRRCTQYAKLRGDEEKKIC